MLHDDIIYINHKELKDIYDESKIIVIIIISNLFNFPDIIILKYYTCMHYVYVKY